MTGNFIRKYYHSHNPRTERVFWVAVIFIIFIWNISIWGNFVIEGFKNGNDIGGTARYVHSRAHIKNHSFYLAASREYMYYSWGEDWQWENWLGFFKDRNVQYSEVIEPGEVISRKLKPPFTIFMSHQLFTPFKDPLLKKYPNLTVHPIKPDKSLVALEVLD